MSFQQGLSGLSTASQALNAISNNVANSGTVGFKQSQAQFQDVYAAALGLGSASRVGIGSSINQVAQQFTQGNITTTSNPLDIAINGQGFFRMSDNGTISYSRNGQFHVDSSGYIVNAAGQNLTGYAADANGNIIASAPTPLQLSSADIAPKATTTATAVVNLNSGSTTPTTTPFDLTDPTSYNWTTSQNVYDSLGNSHTMSMYFVKTGSNAWDMYTTVDGDATQVTSSSLTFDTAGSLTSPTAGVAQSFTTTTGSGTMNFTLDLTGTTQYGSASGLNSLSQDGYTSGRLSGLSIDPTGVILGNYSNGQSRNLGQVVLANFNNPNGLQPLGGNQWAETTASGSPAVGAPGTGSLGVVQGEAVEDSNVDLTSELVDMITQQRAYQANAQSIKTEDSILQTLVNLR